MEHGTVLGTVLVHTVKPLYKNTLGTTNYILIEEVFLYRGKSHDRKNSKNSSRGRNTYRFPILD